MELRNVRTFVSVAGLLSFRRAAAVLHYAPSTVSAHVQALEEELQIKLFDRLEKGIRLTEAGARFLPYAGRLLDLAEDSVSAAQGEQACPGMLAIRMPETLAAYRFPALLPRFRQAHPAVGLRLRGSSSHGVRRYLEKGLDLAFLVGEARPADNCCIERLGTEALVLAGNVADWGVGPVGIEPADLARRLLLCASSDTSARSVLQRCLGRHGVEGNVWLDCSSLTALKNALFATSGGCAFLPRIALAGELAGGRASELILPGLPDNLPVNMLWHREKWLSPSLAFFMDLSRAAWPQAASEREQPAAATSCCDP